MKILIDKSSNITLVGNPEELLEFMLKYNTQEKHKIPNNVNIYDKWFDETSTGWTRDPVMNFRFLRLQENYANDKLKHKGHLFLNEVYDMLGLSRTSLGQTVGWIYDKKNPVGDNFVDFGLADDCNRGFLNGYVNTALLKFNVDGDILRYFEEEE